MILKTNIERLGDIHVGFDWLAGWTQTLDEPEEPPCAEIYSVEDTDGVEHEITDEEQQMILNECAAYYLEMMEG